MSRLSRRPEIGAQYIDSHRDWYRFVNKFFSCKKDNIKVSLSKYYSDKIFSDLERKRNFLKNLMMKNLRGMSDMLERQAHQLDLLLKIKSTRDLYSRIETKKQEENMKKID